MVAMNLVEHAERELALCGQTAEDPEYAASIVNAIRSFTTYGHSGGSASVAIEQLRRLLAHENLAPLTGAPDEWEDRSEQTGSPFWQNRRNSKAFSEDGGKTWYTIGNEDRGDDGYRGALQELADAAGRHLYDAAEASPEVRQELRDRLIAAENAARDVLDLAVLLGEVAPIDAPNGR